MLVRSPTIFHLDQINQIDQTNQSIHPSVTSKAKRLLDIVGAAIGLTITALLFIPIAIAIQLDTPGSVLYHQVRCGLNGKTFRIWKFRSMVSEADHLKHLVQNQASGNIFKNYNDPRITRVGLFLRRTSLDELPQFWNVLKGDMSLVGTRPPTIDEAVKYEHHHWNRLNVKAGITGEWQVSGRSEVESFDDILTMDLAYQEKWSIAYDFLILWYTILVVFKRRGAH